MTYLALLIGLLMGIAVGYGIRWWQSEDSWEEIEPILEIIPPVVEEIPEPPPSGVEEMAPQAEEMVSMINNRKGSSVAKRHLVYKRLIHANPDAKHSDVGLAIELAVQKFKKESK